MINGMGHGPIWASDGSRISGKGVLMYKGVGFVLLNLSIFS